MKYTVIIPVYKAEATLEKCLDSLIGQGCSDAELILVNDGSPDGSGEICARYAEKYPCVRYAVKENGGVSTARNLALDMARGEYVLFVDSDDYVSDDYFAVIDRALEDTQPDLLMFGFAYFGGMSGAWSCGNYYRDDETGVAKRVSGAIREYLFSSLWTKVFRRGIIEEYSLRFNEKLSVSEDHGFAVSYAAHIKSVASIEAILYHVCVENKNSLSRRPRRDLARQLIDSYREMIAAVDASALSERAKRIYSGAIAWMFYRGAYSSAKELLKFGMSARARRKEIRGICAAFNREHIRPRDIKCRLIALPVKLKAAFVIDFLIRNR